MRYFLKFFPYFLGLDNYRAHFITDGLEITTSLACLALFAVRLAMSVQQLVFHPTRWSFNSGIFLGCQLILNFNGIIDGVEALAGRVHFEAIFIRIWVLNGMISVGQLPDIMLPEQI